jgi:hypothetical protein
LWGLGIGDWGLGIGPNPQSPIPNPQSPNFIIQKGFLGKALNPFIFTLDLMKIFKINQLTIENKIKCLMFEK